MTKTYEAVELILKSKFGRVAADLLSQIKFFNSFNCPEAFSNDSIQSQ